MTSAMSSAARAAETGLGSARSPPPDRTEWLGVATLFCLASTLLMLNLGNQALVFSRRCGHRDIPHLSTGQSDGAVTPASTSISVGSTGPPLTSGSE